MEYTVDLGAQVGALAADEELGDRLLTALERLDGLVAAPVTGQNTRTCVLSATFCVSARDALEAVHIATVAMRTALSGSGVPEDARFVEIRIVEEQDDAPEASLS